MSFEAVPCMFKSRQEDGAEAALFGLLIRPSAASSAALVASAPPQGAAKQLALAADSSTTTAALALSTAAASTASSSLQIVPSDSKGGQRTAAVASLQQQQQQQQPCSSSVQMVQLQPTRGTATAPFALLAPPGMPPILPRPKQQPTKTAAIQPRPSSSKGTQQQQQAAAGTASAASSANGSFEAQSPPSQVVPQLTVIGGHQSDALSIATSSSLPGPSTPQPNLGLLTIQSPNKEKQPQTAKDRDQQQQQPTEKRPSKKNSSNNSKRIRRPKQQKQEQEKNCPAAGQMLLAAEPPQQQDGQLGEDLHAIEFSQLVNTTVITTEDYFRSQPEAPIYTNLDMYGPSQCHGNQQQPQQQQNNGTNGPMGMQQVNRVMERSGQQQQQQTHFQHADQQASCSNNNNDSQPTAALCHSAIYLHNQHQHHLQQQQQQQQAAAAHSTQNFPGPSTSSAQVRFLDPGSTTANGSCCLQQQQQAVQQQQQHPQQQPFSTAQQQQQPPVGWHPYLVAHPGGGHISSTPDSGIQSIDGSPPSVYTPPMVSPYSSQVRSCESVGAPNGGHAGANGILLCQNNGNNNFHCYAPGSNSGGLCCNGGGENNMLLISAPAICLQPQQQAPPRLVGNSTTMMLVNGHGHHDQQGHAEMMIEAGEEEGADGSSEDGGDFSDMPKLVPVTHSEQDEEAEEGREMSSSTTTATNGSQPSTSAAASNASPTEEQQQLKEASPQESAGAEAALLMGVPTELLMGRSMTLQELAECISASIPPEKLKQLTSLIQSKAANSVQQQQQQQQSNVVPTSSSAEQGSANEQQLKNQKKAKKGTSIASLSAEQQQPSTSTSSSGSAELTQQKQPKRRKKPAADKMVVSTSRQPTELKTKCEKLASKVHSKGPRRPSQQSRPLSDTKVIEEKEEEQQSPAANETTPESPEAMVEEEAARAEREEQKLAAYRLKVRAHLARKLDAFLGQVCQQMDGIHLGIRNEHWVPGHWPGWRRRLDWTQIHQRVAANQQKQNGTEEDQKVLKKRGRKKKLQRMEEKEEVEAVHQQQKTDGMEEEKKEQRESRKRRHEKEAEKAEKRRRMEEEGKRSQRPSRSKDEQKRKKTIKKTTAPPIILNLSSLLKKGGSSGAGKKNKRKKTHSPSPSSRSRIRHPQPSTSSAAPANSMMANGGDVIVQLTPTITSNCIGKARRRKGAMEQQQQPPMPRQPPPALSAQQLAIIRAGHWFLARNLRQAAEERRRRPEEVPESAIGTSTTSLPGLFRQLLAKFCANCRRRYPLLFSRRRLSHQLARPIKMLLGQPNPSPALLMDRFDSLVKQFIGTGQPVEAREQLRVEYLRLKRNLDFQRVQPPLQKDQLQQFTEDRRRAPPPQQQQQQPNAGGKCRTVSGSDSSSSLLHRNLTVDTTLDLSYMDSPNPVGRWNADSATLSPSSDNRDHDCVRCICGMAEDDGVMTQCDQCHFWLHADCLDSPVLDDQKEFVCEFCTRRLATTPRVDIVLKPQPSIKLSGCNYFRTLVSSRGLQVRLNEAVYVERLINDKHKSILRELHEECVRKQQIAGPGPGQSPLKQRRDTSASSGGAKAGGRRPKTGERQPNSRAAAAETEEEDSAEKAAANNRLPNQWWPEEANNLQQMTAADRTENEFHRRDLRVFRVERLFVSPNGQRFIFGCYYARPHETFCDSSRMFYRNELFWTPLFDTLPLDSVVGRCLILEPPIWAVGRPKTPRYLEDDVYVCEYQIDRNQRSFEKIQPKNRYYINTEPYMFNLFPEKKRLKRDFTPFKLAIESESSCRKAVEANDQHQSSEKQQSESLKLRLCQANLEAVCGRIRDIKDQSSSIG